MKNAGPDKILAVILKKLTPELFPILVKLFNHSQKEKKFSLVYESCQLYALFSRTQGNANLCNNITPSA